MTTTTEHDTSPEVFTIGFPNGEGIGDVLARMTDMCVELHLHDGRDVAVQLTGISSDDVQGTLWDDEREDWVGELFTVPVWDVRSVDYL